MSQHRNRWEPPSNLLAAVARAEGFELMGMEDHSEYWKVAASHRFYGHITLSIRGYSDMAKQLRAFAVEAALRGRP